MAQQVAMTIRGTGKLNVLQTPVRVCTPIVDRDVGPDASTGDLIAIWDTGASGSVITQATVDALKLPPIGIANVSTANGSTQSRVYLVDFHFPNANLVLQGLSVTVADLGAGTDVLIGMDAITAGDFAITNRGGRTKMSFRVPSSADVDYVVEANRNNALEAKRNRQVPLNQKRRR